MEIEESGYANIITRSMNASFDDKNRKRYTSVVSDPLSRMTRRMCTPCCS
jgi:hypothetical protein